MHGEMHKRAGEQEQPGKPSQEMRPMLGDEVETDKDEKSDNNDVCTGDRGTLLAATLERGVKVIDRCTAVRHEPYHAEKFRPDRNRCSKEFLARSGQRKDACCRGWRGLHIVAHQTRVALACSCFPSQTSLVRENHSWKLRPGALSIISICAPCRWATAATRLRPSPLPGVRRLRSSR